jgi:tRNA-uridine 2-sulfurtransferase
VKPTREKVLVAMSGGVDSSVAAALLVREGYDVVGCFMRLGSPGETLDELTPLSEPASEPAAPAREGSTGPTCTKPAKVKIGHQGCCSINDAADARLVAAELGIPFYVCNFKKDFGRIITYFADEYAEGRTPNPCVRCNDWLKFGKLHDYAAQIGATHVASGHYAQIRGTGPSSPRGTGLRPVSNFCLYRGLDPAKDQSYVLFGAPRDRLAHMMFPIGHLPKPEVRDLAAKFGLPVFDKPDSQEICFVPDQDYAGLVERVRGDTAKPGTIVDTTGKRVGEHQGQHRFTIGQRRGVNVALGYPVYVVGKDAKTNVVIVGSKADLEVSACAAGEANWLVEPPSPGQERPVIAKYRYNTPGVPARVRLLPDSPTPGPSGRPGRFAVTFDTPQHAVAPGQAIVLYDSDQVLGGGWIEGVERHGKPENATDPS